MFASWKLLSPPDTGNVCAEEKPIIICKASITLSQNLTKKAQKKENYRPISSININAKLLNKIYKHMKYSTVTLEVFPLKTETEQYTHYTIII